MSAGIAGGGAVNGRVGVASGQGSLENYLPQGAVSFPQILSKLQSLDNEDATGAVKDGENLLEKNITEITAAERKMAQWSFRQAQGQEVNLEEAAMTARKLGLQVNYISALTRSLTSSLKELLNTQV